jgi:hypothetical protein
MRQQGFNRGLINEETTSTGGVLLMAEMACRPCFEHCPGH